ncbi:hypothetical protein PAAG_00214 [Paracoccidioides lutzii Pb01]|uniref:Uncharacterized protein n=1 Tax=Paracoccidioides lutzii (strain ATCC MYA-826 / Pb01) TaxID=502779 RepID=C1GNW9_PARBA|nr:hypothetical protein PAAG_00214 [Paracoccidioides lutzii Pb01]EEH35891.2 hypothetical protein PAAG_00214 [Paracoccidioides lutzii Pb01]
MPPQSPKNRLTVREKVLHRLYGLILLKDTLRVPSRHETATRIPDISSSDEDTRKKMNTTAEAMLDEMIQEMKTDFKNDLTRAGPMYIHADSSADMTSTLADVGAVARVGMQAFEIASYLGSLSLSDPVYAIEPPPTTNPYQNLHPLQQQAPQFQFQFQLQSQSHDNIAISPSTPMPMPCRCPISIPIPNPIHHATPPAPLYSHFPSNPLPLPHSSSGNNTATAFQESNTIHKSNGQQQQASGSHLNSPAQRGRDASGEGPPSQQ